MEKRITQHWNGSQLTNYLCGKVPSYAEGLDAW